MGGFAAHTPPTPNLLLVYASREWVNQNPVIVKPAGTGEFTDPHKEH